eukprot:1622769-Pyramimonas_sp.AAC.1
MTTATTREEAAESAPCEHGHLFCASSEKQRRACCSLTSVLVEFRRAFEPSPAWPTTNPLRKHCARLSVGTQSVTTHGVLT